MIESDGGLEYDEIFKLLHQAHPLSSIWSYHQKCHPNYKSLNHWKLWIYVKDSQQVHGRDFWVPSTPINSWSTFCFIILLSTIPKLTPRQVDYTQLFLKLWVNWPHFYSFCTRMGICWGNMAKLTSKP